MYRQNVADAFFAALQERMERQRRGSTDSGPALRIAASGSAGGDISPGGGGGDDVSGWASPTGRVSERHRSRGKEASGGHARSASPARAAVGRRASAPDAGTAGLAGRGAGAAAAIASARLGGTSGSLGVGQPLFDDSDISALVDTSGMDLSRHYPPSQPVSSNPFRAYPSAGALSRMGERDAGADARPTTHSTRVEAALRESRAFFDLSAPSSRSKGPRGVVVPMHPAPPPPAGPPPPASPYPSRRQTRSAGGDGLQPPPQHSVAAGSDATPHDDAGTLERGPHRPAATQAVTADDEASAARADRVRRRQARAAASASARSRRRQSGSPLAGAAEEAAAAAATADEPPLSPPAVSSRHALVDRPSPLHRRPSHSAEGFRVSLGSPAAARGGHGPGGVAPRPHTPPVVPVAPTVLAGSGRERAAVASRERVANAAKLENTYALAATVGDAYVSTRHDDGVPQPGSGPLSGRDGGSRHTMTASGRGQRTGSSGGAGMPHRVEHEPAPVTTVHLQPYDAVEMAHVPVVIHGVDVGGISAAGANVDVMDDAGFVATADALADAINASLDVFFAGQERAGSSGGGGGGRKRVGGVGVARQVGGGGLTAASRRSQRSRGPSSAGGWDDKLTPASAAALFDALAAAESPADGGQAAAVDDFAVLAGVQVHPPAPHLDDSSAAARPVVVQAGALYRGDGHGDAGAPDDRYATGQAAHEAAYGAVQPPQPRRRSLEGGGLFPVPRTHNAPPPQPATSLADGFQLTDSTARAPGHRRRPSLLAPLHPGGGGSGSSAEGLAITAAPPAQRRSSVSDWEPVREGGGGGLPAGRHGSVGAVAPFSSSPRASPVHDSASLEPAVSRASRPASPELFIGGEDTVERLLPAATLLAAAERPDSAPARKPLGQPRRASVGGRRPSMTDPAAAAAASLLQPPALSTAEGLDYVKAYLFRDSSGRDSSAGAGDGGPTRPADSSAVSPAAGAADGAIANRGRRTSLSHAIMALGEGGSGGGTSGAPSLVGSPVPSDGSASRSASPMGLAGGTVAIGDRRNAPPPRRKEQGEAYRYTVERGAEAGADVTRKHRRPSVVDPAHAALVELTGQGTDNAATAAAAAATRAATADTGTGGWHAGGDVDSGGEDLLASGVGRGGASPRLDAHIHDGGLSPVHLQPRRSGTPSHHHPRRRSVGSAGLGVGPGISPQPDGSGGAPGDGGGDAAGGDGHHGRRHRDGSRRRRHRHRRGDGPGERIPGRDEAVEEGVDAKADDERRRHHRRRHRHRHHRDRAPDAAGGGGAEARSASAGEGDGDAPTHRSQRRHHGRRRRHRRHRGGEEGAPVAEGKEADAPPDEADLGPGGGNGDGTRRGPGRSHRRRHRRDGSGSGVGGGAAGGGKEGWDHDDHGQGDAEGSPDGGRDFLRRREAEPSALGQLGPRPDRDVGSRVDAGSGGDGGRQHVTRRSAPRGGPTRRGGPQRAGAQGGVDEASSYSSYDRDSDSDSGSYTDGSYTDDSGSYTGSEESDSSDSSWSSWSYSTSSYSDTGSDGESVADSPRLQLAGAPPQGPLHIESGECAAARGPALRFARDASPSSPRWCAQAWSRRFHRHPSRPLVT
jgi:hypothetical protein